MRTARRQSEFDVAAVSDGYDDLQFEGWQAGFSATATANTARASSSERQIASVS
jgi:hypothetical protein